MSFCIIRDSDTITTTTQKILPTNSLNLEKTCNPQKAKTGSANLYVNSNDKKLHIIDDDGVDKPVGAGDVGIYNQDLNTTDNVKFKDVEATGTFTVGGISSIGGYINMNSNNITEVGIIESNGIFNSPGIDFVIDTVDDSSILIGNTSSQNIIIGRNEEGTCTSMSSDVTIFNSTINMPKLTASLPLHLDAGGNITSNYMSISDTIGLAGILKNLDSIDSTMSDRIGVNEKKIEALEVGKLSNPANNTLDMANNGIVGVNSLDVNGTASFGGEVDVNKLSVSTIDMGQDLIISRNSKFAYKFNFDKKITSGMLLKSSSKFFDAVPVDPTDDPDTVAYIGVSQEINGEEGLYMVFAGVVSVAVEDNKKVVAGNTLGRSSLQAGRVCVHKSSTAPLVAIESMNATVDGFVKCIFRK